MAAMSLQHCSECGELLFKSSDELPPRCDSCRKKSQHGSAAPPASPAPPDELTDQFTASAKTVIIGSGSDTDSGLAHHAMTVDFIPSADPTEPTAHATDNRITNKDLVGRFRVISILGRGTFGTVYRAYDPLLDREVALKVPRFASNDHEMTERFDREAKAAARLHHPNIVTLYENGKTDEGPFLVVELVEGVPLSQTIRENPLDVRVAVDLVRQIAEGLHYAHSEGIVHRDVKPANIMMNRTGRPQIMDFGLAKRSSDIEAGMTMDGQIVGTPNYMSPEQARGTISEIGPHSDQFSVGVMLYEMLCGCQPFTGDPWSIISRVANVHENPLPPRSVKPGLPRDLEACVLKAMEKDPRARYPSLQALADDLDHWIKGLPLLARPIRPLERFVRWCRQNRMIATLGGIVATFFLIAGTVGPWLAFRFDEMATDAKREARAADDARQLELAARLATERAVVDSYTETGLTAHRNGDPREAILWYANAVAASKNYPSRDRHNRIRMQSWLSQIAIPVQAFAMTPAWQTKLCYHPTGHWLMSLSNAGECQLLKASDGTRLAMPMAGPITAATFNSDGTQLALAAGQEIAVFEFVDQSPASDRSGISVQTAEFATQEFDRWTHSDSVNCFEFSADDTLLVLGGERSVQVRDVRSKSFRTDVIELGSQVTSVAISPDGSRLAVRCADQKVRVFSAAPDQGNPEPVLPTLPSASLGIVPPMFPSNDRLVVIDSHVSVRCWNMDSREIVWEYKPGRVLTSVMSPDGKWIALGVDGSVVLLNSETGEPAEQRFKHPNLINSIRFHPSRPWLLTGCVDHSARIFEISSGESIGLPIPHSDSVHHCIWAPDGMTLATANWTGDLIRIWKPSVPQLETTETEATERGPFVRLNRHGDRWMHCGFDSWRDRTEIAVRDVRSGQLIGSKLSGPGLISDADFVDVVGQESKSSLNDLRVGNPPLVVLAGGGTREDARLNLTAQKLETSGFVRIVNSETGESVFPDVSTPSQPIAVRTSPDGQTIIVLCHRGHLLLIDSATGLPRAEQLAFDGQSSVFGYVIRDRIRFSTKGDLFAIWGCNALAELRRTDTGERVAEIHHTSGFVHDAQVSPDGKLVATCSSDYHVRLWDSATGNVAGEPLAHSGWVFSLQFSRDGRKLLTASEDKQARIWNLDTRTVILATREHNDQVFSVTFLPREEFFLTATRDGQVTAWDATLGKMIAPVRTFPGMVYQLSQQNNSPLVITSGQFKPTRVFNWSHWILDPDMTLTRTDVLLLGELLASQRVHEGGAATRLTSAEWIDRWNQFHERHPDYLRLRVGTNTE